MKTQTDEKGDTWGPWIAHDGTGCPVPRGTMVIVRRRGGTEDGPFPALTLRSVGEVLQSWSGKDSGSSAWHWAYPRHASYRGPHIDIIAYRVQKPRGLAMLEEILREVEETHPLRGKPETAPWPALGRVETAAPGA